MNRKVNLVGPSTLSISLPSKWVKDNGIKKGDELVVEPHGRTLAVSVSSEGAPASRSVTLDIRGLDPVTRRAFDALYKRGYDEIVVQHASAEELAPVLAAIANEAKSFEVVAQTPGSCVLRSVSELTPGEADGLLRRTVALLVEMMAGIAGALERSDAAALQALVQLEATNNRFTHLLRRAVNRGEHTDATDAHLRYAFIEELESTADEMKRLCRCVPARAKVPQRTAALARRIADLVERFASLFVSFGIAAAASFSTTFDDIERDVLASLRLSHGDETLLLCHLLAIVRATYSMGGVVVSMRY